MPWKKSEPMEQRTEFALRAMQTLNFRALCQQYGISTKTGYKWRERFWRKGLAGMEEESRRPKSHYKQLAEEEVCEIVRLKLAHLAWGPRKIRELYLRRHGEVASESTFKRVLEITSLTQKRRRRRAPEAGRLSSGRQAAALNEVWTVDFKGWWRKAEQRCEPLTVRDEYSRYLLEVRAVEDARSETVRKSFERIFERHGLPEAIRSDNGSPFASRQGVLGLSRLSACWESIWNGVDLVILRTMPGMSACTKTSAASWKQKEHAIKLLWMCGQRALTTNGRMKRWGCAAQAKSTSLRRENTKAHRKIWIIQRCALAGSAPRG